MTEPTHTEILTEIRVSAARVEERLDAVREDVAELRVETTANRDAIAALASRPRGASPKQVGAAAAVIIGALTAGGFSMSIGRSNDADDVEARAADLTEIKLDRIAELEAERAEEERRREAAERALVEVVRQAHDVVGGEGDATEP